MPPEILSLIPTYFTSQKDRFRAASVCRCWRRALLKNGALWAQLFLRKGEGSVSALLDRAKGSPLDVITHGDVSDGILSLISPRARQIRHLELHLNSWKNITTFSEFNSGRLPLLRTLKIVSSETYDLDGRHIPSVPPSHLFFGGSPNLEEFTFNSMRFQFLSRFIFPNLTTFTLSVYPQGKPSASYLFDFLKASPSLRTVKINTQSRISLSGIPREAVVTLDNVDTFSLGVTNHFPGMDVYDIAARISCPRARDTSLIQRIDDQDMGTHLDIFSCSDLWGKIVHQYTASPMEEVTLEIQRVQYEAIRCFFTFRSSDATALQLEFHIADNEMDEEELLIPLGDMDWEIFSQALATIQGYPLLSHIKRLCIKHNAAPPDDYHLEEEVRELFSSLGPLDELTIHGCDLRILGTNFVDEISDSEQMVDFPQIKELKILHPRTEYDGTECMEAIAKLAESQHALGIPFERVTIRMWIFPEEMVEELREWVGEVDCCKEWDPEE